MLTLTKPATRRRPLTRTVPLVLLLALGAPVAGAEDWYVDDDADCASADGGAASPFCLIQEAIDAAQDGDTIFIASGTYVEALTIDKDLSLVGAGVEEGAVVDGSVRGNPATVTVHAAEVHISGLRLTGAKGSISTGVRGGSGLLVAAGATVSVLGCEVSENEASNRAGGIDNHGDLSLVDCQIIENSSHAIDTTGTYRGEGGGIYNRGSLRLKRSRVIGNSCPEQGGGIWNVGTLDIQDSAIHGNSAGLGWGSTALGAEGGGIYSEGTLEIDSSTISGNHAMRAGGGIFVRGGSVSLSHVIVARNTAGYGRRGPGPDCHGTLTSLGYNLIGKTRSCTILGDETGNLYDVDPRFEDPDGPDDDPSTWEDNDWSLGRHPPGVGKSLHPWSPCIDAGDPTASRSGTDLAGNPRNLDGTLDRRMVMDMGAYEFNNVHLAVDGDGTAGTELTIYLTGEEGLQAFLFLGTTRADTPFPPFGSLFVGLRSFWMFLPTGTIPSTVTETIPPTAPPGIELGFQGLGVEPTHGSGNLTPIGAVTTR